MAVVLTLHTPIPYTGSIYPDNAYSSYLSGSMISTLLRCVPEPTFRIAPATKACKKRIFVYGVRHMGLLERSLKAL